MSINDHGKLIVLLVGLAAGIAMVLLGGVTHDPQLITPGVGLIGSIIGYVTGNGVLAVKGQPPSPAFAAPTHPHHHHGAAGYTGGGGGGGGGGSTGEATT